MRSDWLKFSVCFCLFALIRTSERCKPCDGFQAYLAHLDLPLYLPLIWLFFGSSGRAMLGLWIGGFAPVPAGTPFLKVIFVVVHESTNKIRNLKQICGTEKKSDEYIFQLQILKSNLSQIRRL